MNGGLGVEDCCSGKNQKTIEQRNCPVCGTAGKPVQIITLKSLLISDALTRMNPNEDYLFCNEQYCNVVYFSKIDTFVATDLKVPVYQKTTDENCPVCYCFDWTRKKIKDQLKETDAATIIAMISEHMKAGRCGCEVNNPQGSCCLANVKQYIKDA